jgi:HlyD family secretion protein
MAEIMTASRENVLLVPNAALRFTPEIESDRDQKPPVGIVGSLIPHPPPLPTRGCARKQIGSLENESEIVTAQQRALNAGLTRVSFVQPGGSGVRDLSD